MLPEQSEYTVPYVILCKKEQVPALVDIVSFHGMILNEDEPVEIKQMGMLLVMSVLDKIRASGNSGSFTLVGLEMDLFYHACYSTKRLYHVKFYTDFLKLVSKVQKYTSIEKQRKINRQTAIAMMDYSDLTFAHIPQFQYVRNFIALNLERLN